MGIRIRIITQINNIYVGVEVYDSIKIYLDIDNKEKAKKIGSDKIVVDLFFKVVNYFQISKEMKKMVNENVSEKNNYFSNNFLKEEIL